MLFRSAKYLKFILRSSRSWTTIPTVKEASAKEIDALIAGFKASDASFEPEGADASPSADAASGNVQTNQNASEAAIGEAQRLGVDLGLRGGGAGDQQGRSDQHRDEVQCHASRACSTPRSTDGLSVRMPSTPRSSSRCISPGSSIVHTWTCTWRR